MSTEVTRRHILQMAMMPALLRQSRVGDMPPTVSKVYPGPDGKLVYVPDDEGNIIHDSSHAGYRGGGVPIPAVPVKEAIWPVPGDNTAHVQAAIDRVSALPLDRSGLRGAVLLKAGIYRMATPVTIEISPDGKTLYVNNTWAQPGENFVWAYDIAADGSLSNKRQFAMLNLTPDVLGAAAPGDRFDSRADGTAVDTDGRYYVATKSGVQIFLPDGTTAGTIWVPQYPVNITFGGPNGDVLYLVGESSAWSIQTKVRGFRVPQGLY